MREEIYNEFIKQMKRKSIDIRSNVLLKPYTSLQIGGIAKLFYEPSTVDEIRWIIQAAKALDIAYYVIGNGSNVLVNDQGVDGLVLVTKTNFKKIAICNETQIYAQAGATLMDVCRFACEHQLSGLEFAWGIPATVGGASYMNAGAYGGEIKDVLLFCTYLDEYGNIVTLANEHLNFSYRSSIFNERNVIILEAIFSLEHGNRDTIQAQMDVLLKRRESKQPLEYPSAGSTFKRPKDNYASALIEQAGLKGYQLGNAMVSAKHAGFIINYNQASSDEFLKLINTVKYIVKEKTGYDLHCEIKLIGFQDAKQSDILKK